MRIAFLIGPGGSGKGTQAKLLIDEAMAKTGHRVAWTEMSKQLETDPACKAIMDRGELCSDSVVCDFFDRTMAQVISCDTWLADGFPRTKGQALHALSMAERGHEILFIEFDILPEAAARRCEGRDRGPDDSIEVTRIRIAKFKEQTEPALRLLRSSAPSIYTTIDASPPPEVVFSQIRGVFGL